MKQTSMTALVSAFARAYHAAHNTVKIFDDPLARRLLTDGEYAAGAAHMADGSSFFAPSFAGSRDDALRLIVDRFLSPAPLARAAFTEEALRDAAADGAAQYLLFGAGYDTFAYRQPDWAARLQIFELDRPAMLADKQARLARAGLDAPANVYFVPADLARPDWPDALAAHPAFEPSAVSFCSLLGLVHYLSLEAFGALLEAAASLLPAGSLLAFDYPMPGHAQALNQLAAAAGEPMCAGYDFPALEALLHAHGFRVRAHWSPNGITARWFSAYNAANPAHPMAAGPGAGLCLAEISSFTKYSSNRAPKGI